MQLDGHIEHLDGIKYMLSVLYNHTITGINIINITSACVSKACGGAPI